jgi:translation initiation factor 2B subunit (eIF-2B alpha/beta/delta family)
MARVRAIADDRESGATRLLHAAIAVLREARERPAELPGVAAALCRAQPTMASLWNAALEALASRADPDRFERFTRRVERAPQALARFARACFDADSPTGPLRVVTISSSGSVRVALEALRERRPLHVACSESRPALEGRVLAASLAASGIAVTCFSDAAIAAALADADAVLVGADAVTPTTVLNKCGTRMLAAAAALTGVPVYVVATRDKFVPLAVAARLVVREGEPSELWERPPDGVTLRNPYFETVPLDLISAVISDLGVLGAGTIPEVCRAAHDDARQRALDEIG